uniref:uncharacterized protein LOC122601545 n=1 Tax=Erigeron canadensis TaxID=72917 RepID=UPI001CB8A3B7|nr:uncharacterized protein LOC122601545 [Erigeron canadensis]
MDNSPYNRAWSSIPGRPSFPGPWGNICKVSRAFANYDTDLDLLIKGVLGNGKSIRFWLDLWIGMEPLMARFPNLFKLESAKNYFVADRIASTSYGSTFTFTWNRLPTTQQKTDEYSSMLGLIDTARLSSSGDKWCWDLDQINSFSVKSIKKKLEAQVLFLAWRANLERLPTLASLAKRNIQVPSLLCPFCGLDVETPDHIFVSCSTAQGVWDAISDWCRLPGIYLFGVQNIFRTPEFLHGSSKWKKIIHAILCSTVWILWKTRNNKIFNHKLKL